MASIAPRSRPGAQARPGDVTGRKREQLAAEHADAIAERAKEIGLVTAARTRSIEEDVIDLAENTVERPDGSVETYEAEPDEGPVLIGNPQMQIEELPEPAAEPQVITTDQDYHMQKVIVRFNTDLEDVTLGYDNTFTFREGQRYRIPRWAAEHFASKGLIWARE